MSNKVILIENALEPETWLEAETDDVRAFLFEHFKGEWPDTARLYLDQVSLTSDVTPFDATGVERLGELEGTFYCVVYPAGGIAAIIAIVIIAVVAVTVLMKPSIPTTTLRNTQATSPNNELSARTNSARVKGRIPDIFGTVRSTPDLISLSYTTFINNQEVEHSEMCIGRGTYQINDMYDGETPLEFIAGSSVEVYAPNTDIWSGLPYYSVGTAITVPPRKVTKSNSVNGQVLRAPNVNTYVGNADVYFQYPDGVVLVSSDPDKDFTDYFTTTDSLIITNSSFFSTGSSSVENVQPLTADSFRFPMPGGGIGSIGSVGDSVVLASAVFIVRTPVTDVVEAVYDLSGTYVVASITSTFYGPDEYAVIGLTSPASINPQWNYVDDFSLPPLTPIVLRTVGGSSAFDLNGTYPILSVTSNLITLGSTSAINPGWDFVATLPGARTELGSPTLAVSGPKWVGPFVLEQSDRDGMIINLVAQNGVYKDDGSTQTKFTVTVEAEIRQVNSVNVPFGPTYTYSATLVGSSVARDQVALTMEVGPPFVGRCQVRMRRVSATDKEFKGSVIDEVKWRDLYGAAPFPRNNFGNVTIVRSLTYATSGALTLKERKLNTEVTRMIPLWVGGTSFTPDLHATNDAAHIMAFVSLDRYIGNRALNEIDFASIFAARDDAIAYFGTDKAFEFCYTFDSDNLSYEETISSIASTVFCQSYRRGNVLKLMFERSTDDSVMLFNHRNKIPNSEVRTVTFGYGNDNDGIDYEWVSPIDDAVVIYSLPEDGSAVNPKKIESIGVRNGLHAHFQAWRYWNRIRYENQNVEFEATSEANLLVLQERILNADNTRPNTQDGDIIEQDGLLLVASRELATVVGVAYTIFLQLSDKTVQGISVSSISGRNIVLATPPRLPLVTAVDTYCRTTFVLVAATSTRSDAFLVTAKDPIDNFSTKITAVNYSANYWQNDKDFINGIVNEDGIPI